MCNYDTYLIDKYILRSHLCITLKLPSRFSNNCQIRPLKATNNNMNRLLSKNSVSLAIIIFF